MILGGGLARLGELLLEPLRETVRRRTLVSSVAASEIAHERARDRGPSPIGAATLRAQGGARRLAPLPGRPARREEVA